MYNEIDIYQQKSNPFKPSYMLSQEAVPRESNLFLQLRLGDMKVAQINVVSLSQMHLLYIGGS